MNWRKLIIAVALLAACMGGAAGTAQAHLKTCSAKQPARAELECGKSVLHSNSTAAHWIKNHASRTIEAANTAALWRGRLKFHLWMVRRAHRWITQAYNRTHRTQAGLYTGTSGIAHYALWNCIHNGAYPGAPHEGNSSSGTYTGPLQMTYPWAGYYIRWYYIPITRVYQIAELVFRRERYSTSWLISQWPNTAPPCLRYAN